MSIDLSFIEDEALREQVKGVTDKMFTQAQLDKRINDAVQKQIRDNKAIEAEIRKQIEEEAKMTAEEKANQILEEAQRTKAEALTLQNRVSALDKCVAAGMSKEDAEPILALLVNGDAEASMKNVDVYLQQFQNLTAKAAQAAAGNIPKPKQGGNEVVTKEDFKKMSYQQQFDFKRDNPELAAEFMK